MSTGASEELLRHLKERTGGWLSGSRLDLFILSGDLITFPLWNASGQFMGTHTYDFRSHCKKDNEAGSRYFTERPRRTPVPWGIEFIDYTEDLYVCEGLFDAIAIINSGRQCIATLANRDISLKKWLQTIPCKTVAVCEGDLAGLAMAELCDYFTLLPYGEDADSLTLEELDFCLSEYLPTKEFNVSKSETVPNIRQRMYNMLQPQACTCGKENSLLPCFSFEDDEVVKFFRRCECGHSSNATVLVPSLAGLAAYVLRGDMNNNYIACQIECHMKGIRLTKEDCMGCHDPDDESFMLGICCGQKLQVRDLTEEELKVALSRHAAAHRIKLAAKKLTW